jgi:hypothetical protein
MFDFGLLQRNIIFLLERLNVGLLCDKQATQSLYLTYNFQIILFQRNIIRLLERLNVGLRKASTQPTIFNSLIIH